MIYLINLITQLSILPSPSAARVGANQYPALGMSGSMFVPGSRLASASSDLPWGYLFCCLRSTCRGARSRSANAQRSLRLCLFTLASSEATNAGLLVPLLSHSQATTNMDPVLWVSPGVKTLQHHEYGRDIARTRKCRATYNIRRTGR